MRRWLEDGGRREGRLKEDWVLQLGKGTPGTPRGCARPPEPPGIVFLGGISTSVFLVCLESVSGALDAKIGFV